MGARKRISTQIKVVSAVVPSAGAVATYTPVEVDGTGYNRVLWILHTGACGAGSSTISFKVQNSATAGGSYADQTSCASAGLTKASNASKVHVYDFPVDITRPFMKAVGAVGTDTFALSIVAQLYDKNTSGAQGKYPVDTAYATEIVVV